MKIHPFLILIISLFICCSPDGSGGGTLSIQTPNFRAETIKVDNVVIMPRGKEYSADLKPGLITISISENESAAPAVIQVARGKGNHRSRMIIMKMENSYRVEYYETDANLVEFHVMKAGEKIHLS